MFPQIRAQLHSSPEIVKVLFGLAAIGEKGGGGGNKRRMGQPPEVPFIPG